MTGRKQKYGWKPRGRFRFRRRMIDTMLSPFKGDSTATGAVRYTLGGVNRALVTNDRREAIIAARVLKALKAKRIKVVKAHFDEPSRRMIVGNPTYMMHVSGKSTRVIITARNREIAKEMFLKSDYGKWAPPHRVTAVKYSNDKAYGNPGHTKAALGYYLGRGVRRVCPIHKTLLTHRGKFLKCHSGCRRLYQNPETTGAFADYVWSFYGPHQIYGKFFGHRLKREDLFKAVRIRMRDPNYDGDSFDREKVKEILFSFPQYRRYLQHGPLKNPHRSCEYCKWIARTRYFSIDKEQKKRMAKEYAKHMKFAHRTARNNPYETYGQEMRRKHPDRPWITRPTWELKNMYKALNMLSWQNTDEQKQRLAEVTHELKMRRQLKNPPPVTRPFVCPKCAAKLLPNFMVVTQHLGNRHGMSYTTARQLWDMFRATRNPPAGKIRAALKIAHGLFKYFRTTGIPAGVLQGVPAQYRKEVQTILEYNGVKVRNQNPLTRAEYIEARKDERGFARQARHFKSKGQPDIASYFDGKRWGMIHAIQHYGGASYSRRMKRRFGIPMYRRGKRD